MSRSFAPASLAWRLATPADSPALLESIRAFYALEKIVFDLAKHSAALDALLADTSLGSVFVLAEQGQDGPAVAPSAAFFGHLVLTRGYSVEFGGVFLLLDELYLAPEVRGRGEGKRALAFAAEHARATGVKALRLEVSHENPRARGLYENTGFVAETRDLMTWRLA